MSSLLQDVRYALRMLWKQPGFTAVAVLAIALGVGANTTIFSTVDALLLRPFPFEEPERVLTVWEQNLHGGFIRGSVSPSNFRDLRAQSTTLEDVSAFTNASFNLSEGERPERVEGTVVSASLFRVARARPALGRLFTDEEEQPGRERVAVISHGLWQRRFGGDPKVEGRQLNLNGQQHTVVGVMPPKFNFPPNGGDVWTPLSFAPGEIEKTRGNHYLRVVGRLRPGATQEQARAEVAAIAAKLEQQFPDTNAGRGFGVETLNAYFTRGPKPFLLVLLGAVGFMLLLACANVANLLLVRAARRSKEIGIRMALGAGRLRLIRQLLTESIVLALAGGALGVLFAVWGVWLCAKGIPQSLAKYLPGWENMGVNWRALLFTLGVSVLTGVVFGLAPALQATKTNFNESLKEGGRTSGGALGRNRLRSALIVAEVTLSLVLLIGAGLTVRSFFELLRVRPGFDSANVVVMDIGLAGEKYEERPEARAQFYRQLLPRVESLPGVERAGAVTMLPLSRNNSSSAFTIEGRPPLPHGVETSANWRPSTPGYLAAMNIPLRRGRYLTEQDDREDAPRVVVVNEVMAARHFPGEDPLGRRLNFGGRDTWEIVGVVGNVKHESLDEQVEPEVYVAHAKSPWGQMSLVVRTAGDPVQVVSAVQSELRALDAGQPLFNVRTLDRVVRESVAPQRVATAMMGIFAVISLLLAAIGIYAVMSYAVAQRTHEIGVRLALGAQPADILRMIVRQGMLLTAAGLALGLAASLLLTKQMTAILYNVTPHDPLTFGAIAALLALVALAANYFPARRATKVDPMTALRYE
jgi:putative ABC transport system permease protein